MAGRHRQGELLGRQVVLGHGHREREGDAAAEPPRVGPEVPARRPRRRAGGPARSSPVTPNRRRIARSCPTLVNRAAVAPHADAMSVARARRSSKVLPSPTSCMSAVWRPRPRKARRGRAGAGSAGAGPRDVADPDVAVREPLGLPDGRPGLRLVDRVAGRLEGRVRGGRRRRRPRSDASPSGTTPVRWTIASRATPNRASISSAISPRTRSAIGSNASYSSSSTSRPAWRAASASCPGAGVPGVTRVRPMNVTTPPSSSVARRSRELGREPRRANGSARSSRIRAGVARLVVRAAAHRRDAGELVAVGEGLRRVGVLAVDREPHRRPAGGQGRHRGDRRVPRVLDDRARRRPRAGSSRMPAASRCIANRRTRIRSGIGAHAASTPAVRRRSTAPRRGSSPRRWSRR